MIRNFQKSSGDNVDLSPIYSSLQTINNFLYQLDVQTTLNQAIDSLNNKVNNISNDLSTLQTEFTWFNEKVNNINSRFNDFSEDVTNDISSISTYCTRLSSVIMNVNSRFNYFSGSVTNKFVSFSSSINELSDAYNEINDKISTISDVNSYDGFSFITDRYLTTNLTDYNSYYNSNIEVFEPYIRSILSYDYITSPYPNRRLNIPNATLLDLVTTDTTRLINSCTLAAINGGYYTCRNCSINSLYNFNGNLFYCTVGFARANICTMNNVDVRNFTCNSGRITCGTIYSFVGSNCLFSSCFGSLIAATNCTWDGCTFSNIPYISNYFRSLTMDNQNTLSSCGLTDCELNLIKRSCKFSECTFVNVSFPNLYSTNFYKCSGTIFIPKIVNNSTVFDVNGNYLYNESSYEKTYTEASTYTDDINSSSTYTNYTQYTSTLTTNYYVTTDYTRTISDTAISRVTVNTIVSDHGGLPQYETTSTVDLIVTLTSIQTLTSNATTIFTINEGGVTTTFTGKWQTTSTYLHYNDSILTLTDNYATTAIFTDTLTKNTTLQPQLVVKCLPEFDYHLSPSELIISTFYYNASLNFEFIRDSTSVISMTDCIGDVNLIVDSVNTLCIKNNNFRNLKLDITTFTLSSIVNNSITNCTINTYSNNAIETAIESNIFTNLVVNNYGNQFGISFNENTVYKASFIGTTDDATYSHIYGSYYSVTFDGVNDLTDCTIESMINEGTCHMLNCTINGATLNNKATMYDCNLSYLYIKPGMLSNYSFTGNTFETLIVPQYMEELSASNDIFEMITY